MKRIEIITPQQVPITYQLASVRDRLLAFLLDSLILFSSIGLLYTIIASFNLSPEDFKTYEIVVISTVFLFYSLVFEIFSGGQSPGKIALKIRVIKLNGNELSLTDYFLRWAFRWIDIWGSIGTVAALQISSSGKGQRIGDVLADTTVVRIQSEYQISLKEILKIEAKEAYEPEYPAVAEMTEKEMLGIKMALDQYKKFPNTQHQKVLVSCAIRMRERLSIPPEKSNPVTFLNKLLKDYVTLTRS
ncbi:MAG: RDD family protein [Bacteroidetes bacterium]|nr:RDD family protein [Bacteroidota bacterium]